MSYLKVTFYVCEDTDLEDMAMRVVTSQGRLQELESHLDLSRGHTHNRVEMDLRRWPVCPRRTSL